MKFRVKIMVKKHEAVLITIIVLLGILYNSELSLDSSTCSVKNPNIDCSQRGLLNYADLVNNPQWSKTTGFGTHWINGAPVPEFRSGYQHAVCDLNNTMTCEYHFDTYPALDFPFGFVLHIADALTLYVGYLDENLWQATIWIAIIFTLYLTLRFIEHKLKHIKF